MNERVFIVGVGLISPLGRGCAGTLATLREGQRGLVPLRLFPTPHHAPLPVGEISDVPSHRSLPRTHLLARMAAREALAGRGERPDAVVMGVITGGMPVTEELLKSGVRDPLRYRCHATGSVAASVAREAGCRGPVLTVSTACSSGIVALKIALEMLRGGKAACVLAGGADALCRMTYYGFNVLQLVDPEGARPLDRDRRGMTVAEGAAMFLLVAGADPPDHALAELLGVGLTCDAYHPAAPQPEGSGACRAMERALSDAGLAPADIDYVHLHGTGTVDNDLAEARALHRLFGANMPPLSSTKGASGHAMAAAGAIGTAVAAMSIARRLVPANSGCRVPDPALDLRPVTTPREGEVKAALSNAFGFGGNNASLVLGSPGKWPLRRDAAVGAVPLRILGSACLTGAGDGGATMDRLRGQGRIAGLPNSDDLARDLPPRVIRRLKRLSRMVLSLAVSAHRDAGAPGPPGAVFFGTGWGPLSEVHDFLQELFESEERFAGPTDFIGSVLNAPAGQVAMWFKAGGPNVTMTGEDYSFEQALMSASLLGAESDECLLLIAADEYHRVLSGLFDPSVAPGDAPSDGGAAFCLRPGGIGGGAGMAPRFYERAGDGPGIPRSLIAGLGGEAAIAERFGALFAGIPKAHREKGRGQLDDFLSRTGFSGAVVDYRQWTGEFAAASAVAAFLAVRCVEAGFLPPLPGRDTPEALGGKGILLIGLGECVTALEVMP